MYKIIGNSPKIVQLISDINLVADKKINLLITGETGTGKTTIAAKIHTLSKREGEFITVSYLDDTFVESKLFGHKKGAYTGANKDRCGAIKKAKNGTLFIDEIGDLAMDVQIKLLQLLETGKYSPLGSDEIVEADVRFIFATHVDLAQKVKEGKFREDLFYRINVIKLEVPPLRERYEDLTLWIDLFFEQTCKENSNNFSHELKEKFIDYYQNYPWPGNLRELKNAIQKTLVLSHVPEISTSLSSTEISLNYLNSSDFQEVNIYNSSFAKKQEEIAESSTREICIDDLILLFFNPEKTISEMLGLLENEYFAAVKNLKTNKIVEILNVSTSYCFSRKKKYGEITEKKIKISLNKKTSLRDILTFFTIKIYDEMEKLFPNQDKKFLIKKLGDNQTSYYKRIKTFTAKEIYLGHFFDTGDDKPASDEELLKITFDKDPNVFSPDHFKSYFLAFFEDYQKLQTELKEQKEINKNLKDKLSAIKKAASFI